MKHYQLVSIGLLATTLLFSCKNDTEEKVTNTTSEMTTKKEVKKRVLTPEQSDKVNSLWSKVSVNSDTKSFIRFMTSAGIADTLLSPSSKFTVFAPNNESFGVFTEKYNVTNNPDQKEELVTLLKNHIVVGSMDSSTLVQALKKSAKVELTTLTGDKLTATMDGNDIILTNKTGATAKVKKSDIMASNGVLHVVDAVLK
ncbi:fasciclin domain-containing protein [Rasiella sp. SM2506]|uniref:fasciclin domain-containing protein n=1 Tax=Rasiella sp. SM2506 TaxID=3423914 RepID=UPI003D79508F